MYLSLIPGVEISTGVDKKALEAQRDFVNRVTQGAVPHQKHHMLIQESDDGSGQTIRLEDAQVHIHVSFSVFAHHAEQKYVCTMICFCIFT